MDFDCFSFNIDTLSTLSFDLIVILIVLEAIPPIRG